ncbi:hypothetical protein ONS95_010625 [Cadophora gregata]|uniref:uncharacterized protein n=1 Tax=Cadophora gregata TaxID=51156 RepID=UPI0026DB8B3F|nr:uncharacterized protein ONS95_010625 [Cadophora gregata]KAK0122385.1 hypothetical protein ONS95_010625 [Cadophora gregata]KAK0127864.1 hypothetical protein ONS96_007365 [Cadophora gregata f. sp. sojae]
MPNQPPHPPYSDTYVLPKTKYGKPVNPGMFKDNSFTSEDEDHKTRWWEETWATEEAKQRRLREERLDRGERQDIERSQRYRATTAEELEAYRTWQREAEETERAQARDRRFRQAAKEAEEMMSGEKITVRMQVGIREVEERKQIVPWEWQEGDGATQGQGQSEDSGYVGEGYTSGEGYSDGQDKNKLKKWFKKVLP